MQMGGRAWLEVAGAGRAAVGCPAPAGLLRQTWSRRGLTLLEIVLVLGILAALTAAVVPDLIRRVEQQRLPGSADQLRSLLITARSHAMFDGKRYRVRFPREDELDDEGDDRQPLIEREDDPLLEPGVFNPIKEPWVYGRTLLRDVWCAQVRLGKPTVAKLLEGYQSNDDLEALGKEFEDEDPDFPPLILEPDGTSKWVTFVLTDVPRDRDIEDLEEEDPVIEVIVDGETGLIWLQRRFLEEELDMLEEHHWPAVLRQDFLRPEPLTEDEVLEIQDRVLRG